MPLRIRACEFRRASEFRLDRNPSSYLCSFEDSYQLGHVGCYRYGSLLSYIFSVIVVLLFQILQQQIMTERFLAKNKRIDIEFDRLYYTVPFGRKGK